MAALNLEGLGIGGRPLGQPRLTSMLSMLIGNIPGIADSIVRKREDEGLDFLAPGHPTASARSDDPPPGQGPGPA